MPRPNKGQAPAHWKGSRVLSPEGKQFTATHPALYMHVWCTFEGVSCVAYVDHLNDRGRLLRTQIAKATWKPPAVTERLIVQWAQRALTAWLEGREQSPAVP